MRRLILIAIGTLIAIADVALVTVFHFRRTPPSQLALMSLIVLVILLLFELGAEILGKVSKVSQDLSDKMSEAVRPVKLVFDPKEAVEHLRHMTRTPQPTRFIHAIWSPLKMDDQFREYLMEQSQLLKEHPRLRMTRLVDTSQVSCDALIDHIENAQDELQAGRYQIRLLKTVGVGASVVDGSRAAVNFHAHTDAADVVYVQCDSSEFADAVESLFSELMCSHDCVTLPQLAQKGDLEAILYKVRSYYTKYHGSGRRDASTRPPAAASDTQERGDT